MAYITGIGRLVGEKSWMSAKVVTLCYKIYKECNGFRIKIWHDCHRKMSPKVKHSFRVIHQIFQGRYLSKSQPRR